MVIQIGALKSGRDADVEDDIRAVVEVAHAAGAIVKVIFENAYLTDDEKVRACRLTEAAGADFVKTSTGFAPGGATHDDLRLMRANTSPHIQVKAAGGVRTLDALLEVMALGVTRIGATATETIIDDFGAQGRRARRRSPPRLPAGPGGTDALARLLMPSRARRPHAGQGAPAWLDDGGRRLVLERLGRRRRPTRSRRRAGGAPRRSRRTASSTCSGPATRGSRSRRCSRATARTPGSTRSSSCR